MGQYMPSGDEFARFHIEDLSGSEPPYSAYHKAPQNGAYSCSTGNKYVKVKVGDPITLCCGRAMELMD